MTTVHYVLIFALALIFTFIMRRLNDADPDWSRCRDCEQYFNPRLRMEVYVRPFTKKRIAYALCPTCTKKRNDEEASALEAARSTTRHSKGGVHPTPNSSLRVASAISRPENN